MRTATLIAAGLAGLVATARPAPAQYYGWGYGPAYAPAIPYYPYQYRYPPYPYPYGYSSSPYPPPLADAPPRRHAAHKVAVHHRPRLAWRGRSRVHPAAAHRALLVDPLLGPLPGTPPPRRH